MVPSGSGAGLGSGLARFRRRLRPGRPLRHRLGRGASCRPLPGGSVAAAHRQRDPLALEIDLQHPDLDHVARLDDLGRVLDEAVGQLGDVHQPVLVHADIDERAEGGDVGDDALQLHAGCQVLETLDALGEARGAERGPGIARGLLQLQQNVAHGRQAEALVDEIGGIERLERAAVASQRAQVAAAGRHDPPGERIGLGVHGGAIEGLVAFADPQEPGAQLERLVAQACHLHQLAAAPERAFGVAMQDDRFGQCRTNARDPREQGRGCRVQLDPHRVDRILHDRIQAACQTGLVDVVLILADADAPGLDLHQLGQRVLQAARDRDRTAQRDVDVRHLRGRDGRRRIDRSAGLAHHHLGGRRCRQLGQGRGDQPIGLAARRAIADRDQLDAVGLDQAGQLACGAGGIVAGLERIDRGGLQQLAGGIDHGDLDAGAHARIEPHGGARAGRCRQQQVLEIAGEHADRLLLGALAQQRQQLGREVRRKLGPPGRAHHVHQPGLRRAIARGVDREGRCDHRLGRLDGRGIVLVDHDLDRHHLLVARPEQGECPVAGDLRPRLGIVEIVGILGRLPPPCRPPAWPGPWPLPSGGCAAGRADPHARPSAPPGCRGHPRGRP